MEKRREDGMTDSNATDDFAHDIRITLDKTASSHEWSWELRLDGTTVYGYEPDYLNAEGQATDTLRKMGVDV